MKSKVALHGSYYGDNFGDTLFVEIFNSWMKELEHYDKDNVILPFAGNRVRNFVCVSPQKGIKGLLQAGKIVFIGGGYLGERPNDKLVWNVRLFVRHLSIAFFALLFKKPYIFIGVGAGPLSNKIIRKMVVFLCNRSVKVIVRDVESYDYLIDYGVDKNKIITTVDSVLTLDHSYLENKNIKTIDYINNLRKTNKIIIGVHLPARNEHTDKLSKIINALRDYVDNLKNVKLIVFNDFYKEGYNYIALNMIKERFKDEEFEVYDYTDPNNLIGLISQLDIVITTKLHVGIVANCYGVYSLAFPVHGKTVRFYKQINLKERCIDINTLEQCDVSKLLNSYTNTNDIVSNIPVEQQELAKMNKKIFLDFIN